jgi:hypothetical protein
VLVGALNLFRSGQELEEGFCEHCNELLGSVKGGEFFDEMSECQFLCGVSVVCIEV